MVPEADPILLFVNVGVRLSVGRSDNCLDSVVGFWTIGRLISRCNVDSDAGVRDCR